MRIGSLINWMRNGTIKCKVTRIEWEFGASPIYISGVSFVLWSNILRTSSLSYFMCRSLSLLSCVAPYVGLMAVY